jgi:nitronate monooxygenase
MFDRPPSWPDQRLLDVLGLRVPIIQAPMAAASTTRMAIAVARAGGLGSIACAMLGATHIGEAVAECRRHVTAPVNLNFFCHPAPRHDPAREAAWRARLAPYYAALGVKLSEDAAGPSRAPFDDALCRVVETVRPEVVSFHFGLPEQGLLVRVKAAGARVLGSATTVAEARFLEDHGCDAVIAMGAEAGGHRGNFLTHDMATQIGLFALLPQIVDAVRVPVIAAGGIADGRGITAAMILGAAAVQIGTAYLLTPEASITPAHREALLSVADDGTAVTNLFTGRPARGIMNRLMRDQGPMSDLVPDFPGGAATLAPLRAASRGSPDFANMWAGQGARLARPTPAEELTRMLAEDALARLAPAAG